MSPSKSCRATSAHVHGSCPREVRHAWPLLPARERNLLACLSVLVFAFWVCLFMAHVGEPRRERNQAEDIFNSQVAAPRQDFNESRFIRDERLSYVTTRLMARELGFHPIASFLSWLSSSMFVRFPRLWSHGSTQRAQDDGSQSDDSEYLDDPFSMQKEFESYTFKGIEVASFHDPQETVEGVALLLHGCGQRAIDWYLLPEHRALTRTLHAARIATIAVSARNRASRCWSTRFPASVNQDAFRIGTAFSLWRQNASISKYVPLYGVGVSSGATLLSILSASSAFPQFASQALYMSPGSMRAFRRASPVYPNTLFIRMMQSTLHASASAVDNARKTLLERGVPLVGELPLAPLRLDPLTMHARDSRISPNRSRDIYRALISCDRELIDGGRTTSSKDQCEYGDAIQLLEDNSKLASLLSQPKARRAIEQLLRLITAFPELSSAKAGNVAAWLKENSRTVHRQRRKLRNDTNAIEAA